MKMYFFIWLTILPFIFEAVASQDEWMQLEYISTLNSSYCLTGVLNQSLYIEKCNKDVNDNQNQLWGWDKDGNLRNNRTGSCAVVSDDQQHVNLGSCGVPKEQWTCLPFALKTKTGSYLAASLAVGSGNTLILVYLDSDGKGRWRRFGDPSTNICNYTGQIWRKLEVDLSQKIETGLSFLHVGIYYKHYIKIGYLFMKGEALESGDYQIFSVSVGPTGIWALSKDPLDGPVLWMSNKNARDKEIFKQKIDNPLNFNIDNSSDIDVGPTGIVYIINGSHICSRVGISDSEPEGTDWNCTVGNATLLSCGIDGCFFVDGQNITYQPENKTQQFSTPFSNTIKDIDAGLNYQLWVVTSNHDVYRRIGTSAHSPCGFYWELVPGIQLTTISIGIYGPVGILASGNNGQGGSSFPVATKKGQAVIFNGMPTPERQQELDRLCNNDCKSNSKPLACLARFCRLSGQTSELGCFENPSLTGATQCPAMRRNDRPQFKSTLFKRPLYGNNETQMWLDQLCNDPEVNHIQNLQPSVVNYFASHDENVLKCRSILHEEIVNNTQEIHQKLKHLTEASCAEIPLGLSSGMFPTLGFSPLYSLTGQPRFQNGSSGWCSDRRNNFLEIDFFFVHKICALKLGRYNQVDRWILWYSTDRKHWSEYRQQLKGKYEGTQILPVYIKARYLKLEPVIKSQNDTNYCLKLEVYGSSQAFMADSCDYYGKELAATKDGIYIIYPNQTAHRQLVYCVGLQNRNSSGVRQFPIHSPDLKLYWDSNSTSLTWQGHCSTCRDLVGSSSGILLPINATASLGDFRGTCISDPETCLDGLSFEIWLWFAEYDSQKPSTAKNIILQSGSMASRGIELSVTQTNITFTVYSAKRISECHMQIPNFDQWIHVFGTWIKKTMLAQLFVDDVRAGCANIRLRDTNQTDDFDGDLKLGPIPKIGEGFVVVQNLSIWMRAIEDKERKNLFKHPAPKVPHDWSSWSNCTRQCQQKRCRKCHSHECDVEIIETRICYDIYECGLRMDWPLEDKILSGTCSTCRKLVASSALILPINSNVILKNFNGTCFNGTCLSEPNLCINGLTFGIWIWFAEYDNHTIHEPESTILQSGIDSGITLSATSKNVSFRLFNGKNSRECSLEINDFNRWVHVVGRWVKESNSINLHVDNMNGSCTQNSFNSSDPSFYDSRSGRGNYDNDELVLGPIEKVGGGYVVARNLSIWMRAINETELDYLVKQKSPKVPGPWSNWTKCAWPCKHTRHRKCQSPECDVQINETRICYDVPECAPPSNCNGMLHEGHNTSGIYSIHLRPDFRTRVQVFCEQELLEGGWLVILRRTSGGLNFTRGWEDYKDGFSDLNDDEHWIGNEKLHQLTREGSFKLMVYFYDNQWKSLISSTSCDFFNVTSERENYAWNFKLCEGPASHALSYSNGAKFSTYDRDNDWSKRNCAKHGGGGFWYKNCTKVMFTSPSTKSGFMVSYLTENGSVVELSAVTMMIKPYQKRYLEMNIKIKFVDEKWSEELESDATHAFFLLAGKIKQNIEEVYRGDGTYISATINSFRPGSVIADIILAYITINHTQIISLLQDLSNGYLNGQMNVSYNYSDFTILNPSVPTEWPHITKLYNTSSTSFNISWSQLSTTTAIQGYRIYYKPLADTHWNWSEVPENYHTETEITGLKTFTMYFVNVLAYSVRGNGLPSPFHNVTTDEGVPEVGPANLTAYWNKTDHTVHVTWSQIPQPSVHGYLTHYVITYSNTTHNVTKTSRTNSSVLTGLLVFTEYIIEVAGATRVGNGVKSNIVYRTRGVPLPAPKKLTATNTTGSTINVSWSPLPDDPDFDKLVGYRMYFYDQTHVRNTTIPINQTQVNITDVKPNVDYDITVVGLTAGKREGRRAITSMFIKNITAPKWPPVNLSCPGVSPYTISVGWHAYIAAQTGGSLKGYVLWYNVKGNPRKKMNISLPSYPPWRTLENLRTLTEYEIRVLVYNVKGLSPLANITCKTEEGAPKVTPQNFQAHSYVGETFIALSWQHVADNGTRRGYKLLYRKVSDAGSSVNDTNIKGMMFPADTTKAMVPGLDRYSKYCFQLMVFNQNFNGVPSSSVCAETCRCPRKFYTNWFVQDPYVVTSYKGIFPPLVKRMIHGVCGVCKAHNSTVVVDFKMDGRGGMARKNTSKLVQLVKMTEATQVSFPVVGPKTGSTGRSGSFIPVIDNPSSVFITRKPVVHTIAQFVIEQTLVDTLPLLAFTFVMLLLGAVVIWAVEWTRDETTFPKPFHKGVQQGLWWAFVSVTTVGYGDKVPKSLAGRFFSIFWVLFGTVLVGLITVSLTTALTITLVIMSRDVSLYGSQVAAIDNSLEVQLGLHKGAHVNQGRNFSDVNSILQAVENSDFDGALIDKLTGARLDALRDPTNGLVVKNIIPKTSTYGIFMTGHATKLHKKFRQYLQNDAEFVTGRIKNYTQPLKKGAVSTQNQDQEQPKGTSQENIISASSPVFLPLLLWNFGVLIFLIIVGLAWQFIYYKHVAVAAKKNQVSAVNESKTETSSIQQFVTDFGEETYQKLREMKSRHIEELRVLHKLKSYTDLKK